jgi:hypothetical protein
MGIRLKILSGFLILVCMLIIAGVWSIYELQSMGASVEKLLDENYQSINAARLMTEALERQDSGVLMLLSGSREKAIEILENSNVAFLAAFETAKNNVTIPGEDQYVQAVKTAYSDYRNQYETSIRHLAHEKNPVWYFEKAHPAFLTAKQSIENLMAINQKVMYETATDLHQRANRAVMPGVVAFISALVFAFLFSYLINHYMVNPIIEITNALRQYRKTGKPVNVPIESKDEIQQLAEVLHDFTASSGK